MGSDATPPGGQGPGTTDGGLATVLAATRARLPRVGERPPRRRWPWASVAVIVVAVLLLASLWLWVEVDLDRSSSTPTVTPAPGIPTTFYQTLPTATALARGSYWNWANPNQPPLVFAEGLASPSALGPVVNSSNLGATACTPTLLSGTSAALPALNLAVVDGKALGWLFAFQASAGTLVVVAVINGTASIVASTSSTGSCYNGPGSFAQVPVDSLVAAENASATTVSEKYFDAAAANSTTVSAEFLLVPPNYIKGTPADPLWVVTDSTCPLYGHSSGTGETLTSYIVGTTGLVYSQTKASVSC